MHPSNLLENNILDSLNVTHHFTVEFWNWLVMQTSYNICFQVYYLNILYPIGLRGLCWQSKRCKYINVVRFNNTTHAIELSIRSKFEFHTIFLATLCIAHFRGNIHKHTDYAYGYIDGATPFLILYVALQIYIYVLEESSDRRIFWKNHRFLQAFFRETQNTLKPLLDIYLKTKLKWNMIIIYGGS